MAGKGKIVSGYIAPHPPHLVYGENPPQNIPRSTGGWEMLRWAYDNCRAKIKTYKPDVIIVHTPHWMTQVGHHVTRVPRLKGLSVDPIFPHLFRYNFDTAIDCELADAVYEEARSEGLVARRMTNPNFRMDYGTIVTSHMLNPDWDIPILSLSANTSPYYFSLDVGIEEMYKLGRATRRAIERTGRRAVLAASNTLSHYHFDREPDPSLPEDMSREHVFSHDNYLWDMRVLDLMRKGDMDGLLRTLPEFIAKTSAEIKSGGLFWMLAAMDFPKIPAKVHGYWSVIATGNAVVEWDLEEAAANSHVPEGAHAHG